MSREKYRKNREAVRTRPVLSVRLDEKTREALEIIAEQEDRSAANMIERIVKEYLRGKGMLDCDSDRKESPRKMLMREGAMFQREK